MDKNKIIAFISLSLTALFVAIGFYFIQKHKKEYNYEASYQLYKVNDLLQKNNYQGALNQAKYVAEHFFKSPMSVLAMSYEIGIAQLANIPIDDVKLAQTIASKVKTLPDKYEYEERAAYGLYHQKKYQQAISILDTIPNDAFNKPSALMLEAQCYQKLNNNIKAAAIYNDIIKAFPKTYYANIAQLSLSLINS